MILRCGEHEIDPLCCDCVTYKFRDNAVYLEHNPHEARGDDAIVETLECFTSRDELIFEVSVRARKKKQGR
jgi:hypothetical protein